MSRLWPWVAILLAVGAIVFFLTRGPDDGGSADDAGHAARVDPDAPALRGADGIREARPSEEPPSRVPTSPEEETQEAAVAFLTGTVVDATTGAPIAGADVWLEDHATCPRLPAARVAAGRGSFLGNAVWVRASDAPGGVARTDAEGKFRLAAPKERVPESRSKDLFAEAAAHVTGVACAPAVPGEVTLRLERGLVLRGRVRDPRDRPVAGASLRARPGASTPPLPGHESYAIATEQGDFTLDGLLAGDVVVDADHPDFFPATLGPYDPAKDADLRLTLVPALRAAFKVRSDDGRPVKNVTLQWTTTGPTKRAELLLLSCSDLDVKGEKGSEVQCQVVRVPCDAPSVTFVLKADGYAPWTSPEEQLPPDGAERVYDVVLSMDKGQGSVKVVLEDERGQHVDFNRSRGAVTAVIRLDGPPPAAGYVMESAQDLRFPAMPIGKYRFQVLGAAFAPVEVETTVVGGREEEVRATVRPPAKVRVKFRSTERLVVRFRLTQGGKTVLGVPEGVEAQVDEATNEPVFAAGEEGLVLSGLAPGSYLVEVTSAEVTGTATPVRLEENRTEEVEIDVRRR